MKGNKGCVFVGLLLVIVLHVTGYSYTGERSIRSSVLNSFAYDNMARPSDSTTAYVGFNLLIINDLDIELDRFVCTGWFTVLWNDERLTWSPSVYDDTTYIHALENELWKPEVLVLNAQEDVGLVSDDHLIYRVHNDGNVEWEPLLTLTVHCDIDVTYYPFDTQRCRLELTSWGLPLEELKLTRLWPTVNSDSYNEGPSWRLMGTNVTEGFVVETLNATTESFSQLVFEFTIQRKSGNYLFTTIVPIVISSFLMPCSMLLPVACAERAISGFLVLVVNAVLMTIFTKQIPDIATTSSLLGFFLAGTFILDNLFLALSVFLANFHQRSRKLRLGCIMGILVRILLRITCLYRKPRVEHIEPEVVEDELLDIATDDLKKIHRACADGKWTHPPPTLENGFTEHVMVRETSLPSIYAKLNLNMVKLQKLKSLDPYEEKKQKVQDDVDSSSDDEDDADGNGKLGKGKKGTTKRNREGKNHEFEEQKHIIDVERNEKGKLYMKKLGTDENEGTFKGGKTSTSKSATTPSTSKSVTTKTPSRGVSYQTAVAVFDRLLFVAALSVKVAYNVILIGNLMSDLAVN